MSFDPALISLARQKAQRYGLDGDLVCAIAEQESSWNPWSVRYEPAFYARYTQPMLATKHISPTEATMRATSWGLMQVMGETAREYMFGGPSLAQLCDPAIGLDIGCKVFSAYLSLEGNSVDGALLRYNGGKDASYVQLVKNRIPTYNH